MKIENKLIDIFKLFFSICIVALHSALFEGTKFGYLIKCNIFRLAVPFFFICTGYYVANKVLNNVDIKLSLFKYWKKY